jgi:hypothetical protein
MAPRPPGVSTMPVVHLPKSRSEVEGRKDVGAGTSIHSVISFVEYLPMRFFKFWELAPLQGNDNSARLQLAFV